MNWIMLLSMLSLVACAQTDKDKGQSEYQKQQDSTLADFEKANVLLDQQQFEAAATIYDRLVVAQPANQLDTLIVFNSGLAHLQNQNCAKAIEQFRKVIRSKSGQIPELKGRALLRLGDAYVCAGEDDKTIVTLVELVRGSYALPEEVQFAELPAKLAAAYARIGNRKEAEFYFKKSEKGLLRVQNKIQDLSKKRELLARSLFLMGNLTQINTKSMSSADYFTTLRAMQKYLFKAVELNEETWSPQASGQLENAYSQTWTYIDNLTAEPSGDAQLAARDRMRAQLTVAQEALQSINFLYAERVPDENEPLTVKSLILKIQDQEKRIRNFIAANIVGTQLTSEALAAEGLQRIGRVYNPDPILEQKSKSEMKAKKKK